jgi:hypothetical protein
MKGKNISLKEPSDIIKNASDILGSGPEILVKAATVIAVGVDWLKLIAESLDRDDQAVVALSIYLKFIRDALGKASNDAPDSILTPYIKDSLMFSGINHNPFGNN